MSKRLESESTERRDCYERRVCDDLSEVLLNCLSLDDRLGLRCVSKQFQRTIFSRMEAIEFDINDKVNLDNLERIVKNLTDIKIKFIAGFVCFYERVYFERLYHGLEVLQKSATILTDLECKSLDRIHTQTEHQLFKKFGHKLQSLSIRYLRSDCHWSLLTNLKRLSVEAIYPKLSTLHFAPPKD